MTKKLTQLKDAVAVLVPFREEAYSIVIEADISVQYINFEGSSSTRWHNIIRYAEGNFQLPQLVQTLLQHFPRNPHLMAYLEITEQDYMLGPDIRDVTWKGELSGMQLEKITGSKSTLLPIRFLEVGVQRSKAVARVSIPHAGRVELGSGFLLDGNIFITNNHVLPNVATAEKAYIAFNYEESIGANPIDPEMFRLDPGRGFITSQEEDWTVVCIEGDANEKFGFLELNNKKLQQGDFVNIIQHPGGRYKEIGLYHNVIVYADDNIVQYLTDTEGGSSGAPVLDSEWKVVALHQSGGLLADPSGQPGKTLRNQGIHIRLVEAGVLRLKKQISY